MSSIAAGTTPIETDLGEDRLDIDLHGILGLRFVGASPRDAAAVRHAFGSFQSPLIRTPDVVVRFVERVPLGDLRFVEMGRSGFTDESFVLLAHAGHVVRVALPLDRLGEPCEIVCERNRPFLPVLLPILKLTALAKGFAPLHASAFEFRGAGIIAAGWAHGGKTSALLAFAERGAAYVGDDLVWLRADGDRMYGLPGRLELWDWQVDGLSAARRRVGGTRLALSRAARHLGHLEARMSHAIPAAEQLWRHFRRVSPALQRRLKVNLPLEAVFEQRIALVSEPRIVFLMMSHGGAEITVENADPLVVAERLALSIQQEMQGLVEQYLAFRYAFPDRRSDLIESAHTAAAELLRGALANKETYLVRHPYPVPLTELYAAMRPYCGVSNAVGV